MTLDTKPEKLSSEDQVHLYKADLIHKWEHLYNFHEHSLFEKICTYNL